MQEPDNADLFKPLKWPLRWTHAGLWGEQIVRSAWPLWTVLLTIWALLAFGVHGMVSRQVLFGGFVLAGLAVLITAFLAVRRFRKPTREDAMVRLDSSMPGRPITAALDDQAIGSDDPASQAVWHAHKARMRAKLDDARAVSPDLRVSTMDVYGLRYMALLAFIMAVGFGTLFREDGLVDLAPGTSAQALATGPAWEVWIEPPVYTGKPSLYLNEVKVTELTVPRDSQLTVRLYGEVGSLSLSETVSGIVVDETNQPQTAFTLPIVQDGNISISDEDATSFSITVIDDTLPEVTVTGEVERTPDGEMQLPFEASDDYGVERGEATISLNLAGVDRRHGLVLDPEPVENVIVDLPMPFSGNREDFAEMLIEDLSKHAWASLPVEIKLSVEDGKGQLSQPHLIEVDLPGRRFFQPIAKALIEQRRDLLWNRENRTRIGQILRAVTYEPDGFFNSEPAYLTVRRAITRLDLLAAEPLGDEARDEIAEMLWNAAVVLEEGSLSDALEALRRAQEKLADAMRDGASDEEISELMQELQEAMREYMQRLAEQQRQDGQQQQQQAQNGETQEITQDQLQDMLDEIERLMQEGEMDQAQALLDQLMQMMENMQVAEGQSGQSGQSPGDQAMQGLQETLREQQGLSDEAFRDLQEQFNPDAQAGENQDNEGRNGGQGRGQDHEGEGQGEQQGQQGQGDQQGGEQGGGSLADRQQALREELGRQQRNLPGAGTPEGDAAREALDRAGEAMDRAEGALRDGQTADALDAQSDAMDALRDGMRDLNEMMAQRDGQSQPGGEQQGEASNNRGRDPLGRDAGTNGEIGQDGSVPTDLDARQRSRELLDEIRRRSGEQERPEVEREYLRRLLDRF